MSSDEPIPQDALPGLDDRRLRTGNVGDAARVGYMRADELEKLLEVPERHGHDDQVSPFDREQGIFMPRLDSASIESATDHRRVPVITGDGGPAGHQPEPDRSSDQTRAEDGYAAHV
jgi:hypothetical protein